MNAIREKLNIKLAVGVQPGPVDLKIRNPYGNVSIEASATDRVEVVANIEYDTEEYSAEEVRSLLHLSSGGNAITLTMDKPTAHQALRAELLIHAPISTAITTDVSLGDVSISGTTAAVDVKASLGRVSLEGGRGKIEIETSNGNIEAHNVQPDERLHLKSSMGDISYQGTLTAGKNEVNSTNGNITLKLPRDSQFQLSARTMVGKVRSAFPISGTTNHFVGATVEGGTLSVAGSAPSLHVHAMVGDINVVRQS